jgi:hypothetical protein
MTKAPQPNDHPMPSPKIRVGMKVKPFELTGWARRQIVEFLIKDHLRVLASLRRAGYAKRSPEDPAILSKHTKDAIRAFLHVIDDAHTVEIAGVHGEGHHLGLHTVNACYVDGGSGWSGMTFYGQLLWRALVNGNQLVVLQPSEIVRFLFSERELAKAIIANKDS